MADIRSLGSGMGMFNMGMPAEAGEGQPVMIRMQGIPTMPGYRDRPGKWNIRLRFPERILAFLGLALAGSRRGREAAGD